MSLRDKLIAARDRAKADNDEADRQEILSAWERSISQLCRLVAEWVLPYEKDGLISSVVTPFNVKEEPFGEYVVHSLVLQAGNAKILLRPVARFVSGATGRVDMFTQGRGGLDERYRLLRKSYDDEEDRWAIIKPLNKQTALDKLTAGGSSSYTILGKDSFEHALNDLLG